MKRVALITTACLIAGFAIAKEGDQTAPTTSAAPATNAPPETNAPPTTSAPPAANPTPTASKPDANNKPPVPDKKKRETLSKRAYSRLLASEIRRHSPTKSRYGAGNISVSFTVGPLGRVVSHTVKSSSNPALEQLVKRILASVHTPPPPGGTFSASQEFSFH